MDILKRDKIINRTQSLLGIVINLLGLLGFVSMAFGVTVTFFYLESIKQSAIFPDILTSASALSVLIVVFFILSLILSFNFITPYFAIRYLKQSSILKEQPKLLTSILNNRYYHLIILNILSFILTIISLFDNSERNIITHCIILILCCGLCFCIKQAYSDVNILTFTSIFKKYRWNSIGKLFKNILLIMCIIIPIIYSNYIYIYMLLCSIIIWKSIILDNRINNFFSVCTIPLSFMLSSSFFVLIVIGIIDSKNEQEVYSMTLLVAMILIWLSVYIFNCWLAFDIFKKNQSFRFLMLLFPSITFFILTYFVILFDSEKQLPRYILRPLHFIEYPKDATWYTIDTRFFAPNNLNLEEIKIYSNNLKLYLGYQNEYSSQCPSINKENNCKKQEENFRKTGRYNRFYGYVAWNLGDTKVFCPYGFEKMRKDNNQDKKMKCLALKSEYLIPYY